MKQDKKEKSGKGGCMARRIICGILAVLALVNGVAAVLEIMGTNYHSYSGHCEAFAQSSDVEDKGTTRILCENIVTENGKVYEQALQVEILVSFASFAFLMLYATERRK